MAVATVPRANLEADGLKRDVGFLGLMWASTGSVIGSGWLFGAILVTQYAGPSGILAWVIASVILAFIALVHAELGGMFPVSGGTSRYPHYAFGSLAGGTFGWFSYIQAATVAPIEVLATIQYFSTVSWASSWYKPTSNTLSGTGIAVAGGLMVFFVIVNLIGIRWFARINNTLTTWKVLVPIVAVVWLMSTHFHGSNFHANGGFWVGANGGAAKNVIAAIVPGGVVFSLLGFEQAVQLGGESKNPQRDLPRAVIGGMAIGALIYVLAQLAFTAALDPGTVTSVHTWSCLNPANVGCPKFGPALTAKLGALDSSPYYTLATVAGLGFLAQVLRADAVISPGGTGLVYLTSTSRLSYGLSRNGYVPEIFERTSGKFKIPWFGVILSACVGMIFLVPYSSWASLVGIVTGASVMMYAAAPLALGAFRKSHPELPRSYRLPAAGILAPLSFALAGVVVYWSGWGVYSALMIVIIIGYILYLLSAVFHLNPRTPKIDWGAAIWIFPWMIGMGIISYLGQFPRTPTGILNGIGVFKNFLVGAHDHIPFWWDMAIVAVFNVCIYFLAMWKALPREDIERNIQDVYPPDAGEIIEHQELAGAEAYT